MIIDEEGKMKNKKLNMLATVIAFQSLGGQDFIVGDALVCDSAEVS